MDVSLNKIVWTLGLERRRFTRRLPEGAAGPFVRAVCRHIVHRCGSGADPYGGRRQSSCRRCLRGTKGRRRSGTSPRGAPDSRACELFVPSHTAGQDSNSYNSQGLRLEAAHNAALSVPRAAVDAGEEAKGQVGGPRATSLRRHNRRQAS